MDLTIEQLQRQHAIELKKLASERDALKAMVAELRTTARIRQLRVEGFNGEAVAATVIAGSSPFAFALDDATPTGLALVDADTKKPYRDASGLPVSIETALEQLAELVPWIRQRPEGEAAATPQAARRRVPPPASDPLSSAIAKIASGAR